MFWKKAYNHIVFCQVLVGGSFISNLFHILIYPSLLDLIMFVAIQEY